MSHRGVWLILFFAAPMAEWLRLFIFSILNRSSHRCGSRETSQVLLAGGQVVFLAVSTPPSD